MSQLNTKKTRVQYSPTPSPPSPKFRTLLPNEKIDFEVFRSGVTLLENQCERLMSSLEESRRTIEALTKEKDHYKEFWQVTNNYHSVMSRFQVPAPTATVTPASFPSHIAYSSSLAPLQMAVSSFPGSGYPAFTASDSQPQQSQQAERPRDKSAQEVDTQSRQEASQQPVAFFVPDISSTPEATAAAHNQSPQTPSKRTILAYFAPVSKSVASSAKEVPVIVSNAVNNSLSFPLAPPSHDGLAATNHDSESEPECLLLKTPSIKSQEHMFFIISEEVAASPRENVCDEHSKDLN